MPHEKVSNEKAVNKDLKEVPHEVPHKVPRSYLDVETFRLSIIADIQGELEQDLTKYSKTKRIYKTAFNALTYISSATTTAAALATGIGAGLLATGIGTPVALVLGFTSLGFGSCSFALGAANKKIMPKLQKHTAIVQLINAKLSSFRLTISKALADSTITDEEFHRLQADYDDYRKQKFELQKKSIAAFSQPLEQKEFLVNETLKNIKRP